MAEQTEDIVGLVESVVRPLIEFEDDLEITASNAEDGTILVEVRVHEEDAGKVIGRQGRVIKRLSAPLPVLLLLVRTRMSKWNCD